MHAHKMIKEVPSDLLQLFHWRALSIVETLMNLQLECAAASDE